MSTNAKQMTKLTQDLPTKSEKMRVLAKAGYSRGEISRFLGTSYQFVRNVLVREETRTVAATTTSETPPSASNDGSSNRVHLGSAGQIVLPANIIMNLGLKEGDTLIATVEDEEVRLMTISTAVRKAQQIIRQFVPKGVSLVDELLEDRRREFERERQE